MQHWMMGTNNKKVKGDTIQRKRRMMKFDVAKEHLEYQKMS